MIKMAQNNKQHLFELLKEDQEPFLLKDYIAQKRCQLKKTNNNKTLDLLHLKKRPSPQTTTTTTKAKPKAITTTSISRQKLVCQKASCFYSYSSSPDITKSPLFEFPSPMSIKRSPCKRSPTNTTSNPILLHIPARTAALLLEAALRIQKQSSKPKPKVQKLGLFGSLLKRLTSHRSTTTTTTNNNKNEIVRGTIVRSTQNEVVLETKLRSTVDDCSRPSSSGFWSESNCEDKSLDLETSSSSQTTCCSVDFVSNFNALCDESEEFCDQSPFRFVLQRSPSLSSSGRRTPEFTSPASSPASRRGKLEGQENLKGFQVEEEEEKEQLSPVSVLDPPFEDDYDGHDDDDDDEDEDHGHDDEERDGFDLESSYAIVQRTKNKLLQKLRRFERLAELDPIELEKRMLEDTEEDNYDDEEIEEESDDYESNASDEDHDIDHDGFVREVLSESSYNRAPGHMKRLVSDLIVEEREEQNNVIYNRDQEEIVKCVVKRFDSWKEVKSNTIDMMVEQDFRKELQGIWKNNNKEQIGEAAIEIELAIFGLLVEELAQELVCSSES